MSEFVEFPKIERYEQPVVVTEKIHGTNAQVNITEDGAVIAGSRNRWLTPDDDNYGFARFVSENEDVLRVALGPGRHYGEWYGSGINGGMGMKEKRFALFNTFRWTQPKLDGLLPDRVDVVPELYAGPFIPSEIDAAMTRLKEHGSVIVPGWMHPEGIVIFWSRTGIMLKSKFDEEEVAWSGRTDKPPTLAKSEAEIIAAPFFHPQRLEKLLSRDQRFGLEYPSSLPQLCGAYLSDLKSEVEIDAVAERAIKKTMFVAVKGMMAERGYRA